MCQKCKKKSCSGGCSTSSEAKDIATLRNELSAMKDILDELAENAKFLKCGHPILMLENSDDIASFDAETGLGEDCWAGWAMCNGEMQRSPKTNKPFQTPNLMDKFVVGSGDTYDVGDTGGANSVALDVSEMPQHNHVLNDPGHTHDIEDPGHDHSITQENHSHGAAGASHSHGVELTTDTHPGHEHHTGFTVIGDNNTGSNFNALNDGTTGSSTSTDGAHSHEVNGSTDGASVSVTVDPAAANITVNNNTTGITETEEGHTDITMDTTGESAAHENRPPFFAVMFVIKL